MTAPPVIQVRDPLQENLQFAVQLFVQSRARKEARAREAYDILPEGITAGEATKNKQYADLFKKGFGIDPSKLTPETVLKPSTTQGVMGRILGAGEQAVGAEPGLLPKLGATALATMSGRPARGVTTPAGLTAEAGAGTAAALRDKAIQEGALEAVRDVQRRAAAAPPGSPEAEEFKTFSLGQVAEALPSETAARSMSGYLKFVAAKEGVRVATEKDNPINNLLAPLGITVGDAVGAVATGIDGMLERAISIFASATESQERKSEIWEQARAQTARTVSEAFGGRVDPAFVAAVFQGDEKASNSPIGQELIRFMAAGIGENFTKRVIAGDPNMRAILDAAPLFRIFADDPDRVSTLFSDAMIRAYAREGVDLTQVLPVIRKKRGLLGHVKDFILGGRLEVRPPAERKPEAGKPEGTEQPAGLGRTGGAAPPQPPSLPEALRQPGAGVGLSDQERQALEAFIAAAQSVLGTTGRPQP